MSGDPKEPGGLIRVGATLTVAPILIEPLIARLPETAPRVYYVSESVFRGTSCMLGFNLA